MFTMCSHPVVYLLCTAVQAHHDEQKDEEEEGEAGEGVDYSCGHGVGDHRGLQSFELSNKIAPRSA